MKETKKNTLSPPIHLIFRVKSEQKCTPMPFQTENAKSPGPHFKDSAEGGGAYRRILERKPPIIFPGRLAEEGSGRKATVETAGCSRARLPPPPSRLYPSSAAAKYTRNAVRWKGMRRGRESRREEKRRGEHVRRRLRLQL